MGNVISLQEFKRESLIRREELNKLIEEINFDKFKPHNLSLEELRGEIKKFGCDPDRHEKQVISFLKKIKTGNMKW